MKAEVKKMRFLFSTRVLGSWKTLQSALKALGYPTFVSWILPKGPPQLKILWWRRFSIYLFLYFEPLTIFTLTKLGQKTGYQIMRISAAKYRVCFVAALFHRQEPLPQIWSPRVTKSAGQTLSTLSIFQFLLSNCKLNWDRFSNVSIDKSHQWLMLQSYDTHFWEVVASLDKAVNRCFI